MSEPLAEQLPVALEKQESSSTSEPPPVPVNKEIKPTARAKSTVTIPKLQALHKSGKENKPNVSTSTTVSPLPVQPFTLEELKSAWLEFAEQRKPFKAEFQLLNQEIELKDSIVILHLLNPVQETLLNSLKAELMQYIREKLNNFSIQIRGELDSSDHKQVIYTNREKFEHLATKNPNLRILKDRLGLDTDF